MIESLQFALIITCGLLVAALLALVAFIRHLMRERHQTVDVLAVGQTHINNRINLLQGQLFGLMSSRFEDLLRLDNHSREVDEMRHYLETQMARLLELNPKSQRSETKIVDAKFVEPESDQPQNTRRQDRRRNG